MSCAKECPRSSSPLDICAATFIAACVTAFVLPAACCFARNNNDWDKGQLGFN
jgi:hypothetical protein